MLRNFCNEPRDDFFDTDSLSRFYTDLCKTQQSQFLSDISPILHLDVTHMLQQRMFVVLSVNTADTMRHNKRSV
jgi:hypothetical protein